MDSGANGATRLDDDRARHAKRVKLKQLNLTPILQGRSWACMLIPHTDLFAERICQTRFFSQASYDANKAYSSING